jgi:hypothetical protein
MKGHQIIVVGAFLLPALALAADANLPESAKETEAFLLERIPLGTPMPIAESHMKALGFSCDWWRGGVVIDVIIPSLICRRASIASDGKRQWGVGLMGFEKGNLLSLRATFGDTNPPHLSFWSEHGLVIGALFAIAVAAFGHLLYRESRGSK